MTSGDHEIMGDLIHRECEYLMGYNHVKAARKEERRVPFDLDYCITVRSSDICFYL